MCSILLCKSCSSCSLYTVDLSFCRSDTIVIRIVHVRAFDALTDELNAREHAHTTAVHALVEQLISQEHTALLRQDESYARMLEGFQSHRVH